MMRHKCDKDAIIKEDGAFQICNRRIEAYSYPIRQYNNWNNTTFLPLILKIPFCIYIVLEKERERIQIKKRSQMNRYTSNQRINLNSENSKK